MESVGVIRWRVLEEYDGECLKTKSHSVGKIRWRLSEEYDGDCRRNTMENVGGML